MSLRKNDEFANKGPRQKVLFLGLLVLSAYQLGQTARSQALSARDIARQTLPSVVLVVMSGSQSDSIKYGSGFFVGPDIIATNFHVIENTNKGYVKIVGAETRYEVIGTVGLDRFNDLALLKVRGANARLLSLNKESEIAIGDQVYAVGNPKGLEGTFSQGIVSSIRRENGFNTLQITAPLSPGSSGGPVLDNRGQVIGIAVGAIEGGQSLNFAIPSSYLAELLLKPARLMSLDLASGKSSPEKRPIERIPASPERPRRSFKQPDQTIATAEHRCKGPVSIVEVSHHKFEERFGKWTITSAWDKARIIFNSSGNIEYEEGWNYKDFMDLASIVEGPMEPSRYKWLHTYNYEEQEVVTDLYWAPLTEKILEYRSKDIKKYQAGELIESTSYKANGSLQSRTVETKNAMGGRTSAWFQSDGVKSSSEVTYTDSSGAEVSESQDQRGNVTFRTIKTVSGNIITRLRHNYIGGGIWSKVVSLSDAQNDLQFESTVFLGDRVTEHTKTEYEFDGNGNWVRQVNFNKVTKFGRTYFEPQTATLRKFTYRSKGPGAIKVRPAAR